jgi:hypothetical protein
MPKFDLTKEERHALAEAARQKIRDGRFPLFATLGTLEGSNR